MAKDDTKDTHNQAVLVAMDTVQDTVLELLQAD
jgi:hypothetical protein